MKRLLLFLTVATLVGCTCLSQIPDQLIYVDQNCEAIMPDYTPDVVVVDNCDNPTIIQVPEAGTILDSGQPVVAVVIRASDMSSNQSNEVLFNVVLVDTISPVLSAGPGLLAYNEAVIGRIIRKMHYGVVAMHDSILVNYPQANQDTSFRKDNLMIISSQNSNLMTMAFVDPEHIVFATDSTTLADRCDMNISRIRLQFATNE